MSDDYPTKPCPNHSDRTWEWDGYNWVCVSCVVED